MEYHVNTSQEALELALEFKKSKKYTLFRGQNQDWPVVASINRLSPAKREEAVNKLFAFKLFLSGYKIARKYVDSLDHLIAIAQHYGIPTDFVDFTYSPEIALFFATHSDKDLSGQQGVILCLNKDDFNSFIALINFIFEGQKQNPPYLFESRIENLWRLEAQQGCFLQLMFGGIEQLYKFDKIIFPHTNEIPVDICVTDVYPENKSELELIIENYFAALRIDEGAKRLMRLSQQIGVKIVKGPKRKVYQYVKSRKSHSSWKSPNTKKWTYQLRNTLSASPDVEFTLKIQSRGEFNKDIIRIEEQLTSVFKENKITKKRTIAPVIQYTPRIRSKRISSSINKNVRWMWDGMRTLPYTRKQILRSIAKYLALELYETVKKAEAETLFFLPVLISMSDSFGTHGRCLVSRNNLYCALREDILDIQSDELPKSVSTDVLLYIQKARVVFDFNELIYLFHDEIIPSQMLRSKHSTNPTLFFSPVYIDRLGYA